MMLPYSSVCLCETAGWTAMPSGYSQTDISACRQHRIVVMTGSLTCKIRLCQNRVLFSDTVMILDPESGQRRLRYVLPYTVRNPFLMKSLEDIQGKISDEGCKFGDVN